jgi:hypothetical protein
MQTQALQRPNKGLSADGLKLIAIAAMFVDHAAFIVAPKYYGPLETLMHCIGRITGPTMFFFLAEGYHHTKNINRYTLRLYLFACLSYLPFIYFGTGVLPNGQSFLQLSVVYTLLLAHLALRARYEIQSLPLRVLAVAAVFGLSVFGDWGYLAVIFTLAFDTFRENFRKQALVYSLVAFTQALPQAAGFIRALSMGVSVGWYYWGPLIVMAGLFLPLLPLRFYTGQKGGLGSAGKWLFYAFYPAHLVLLGWLRWR